MSESKPTKAPRRKLARTFFKSFIDVKKWSSYDEVKSNTKTVWGLFRRLTQRPTQELRKENYEDAIARLGLTPEQIDIRKRNFLYSALVYWAFTLIFVVYFIYLLIHLRWLASLLTLVLVVVIAMTAYRENFWYMQMRKKKLGCGFREWLAFIFRREGV